MPVGQHRVLTQDEVKRYFPVGSASRTGARPAKKKLPTRKISKEFSRG